MTLTEVQAYQDRTVIVKLMDGEVTTCKIVFVDSEYEDIVVDILSTNRPANYRNAGASYTVLVADLVSVQEVSVEDSS
jgi:hypothetical protein